jgi:low affinity Fe/Cu permease
MNIRSVFSRLALNTSRLLGTWQAFFVAASIILLWIIGGFQFGFEDTTYQLIINTSTSIVTFLMVFLIQASQNRDTLALHIKLDELIRAAPVARDEIRSIETMTEDDLRALRDSPHD